MEISYGAVNSILCSYRMNKAKNWEVFARPTLIEGQDLSMNGWQTSDGTPVSDKLKSRIALVTTKTTTAETNSMNNLMENQLGDQQLIKSETYSISLNVCKKYVVKTGHRLRLSLGFPAGYGPDDAGVTFKAYHFKRNNAGEVIEVEEIPCVVTQYGLIVTCDSFSPFAIAVVENDGTQNANKSVIVSTSENGQINGANREEGNIVTLSENQTKTLDIVPNEGYEIETVTVGGVQKEVTNKDNMQLVVNYNDITNKNNIVEANFVAKTVAEKEAQREEVAVQPQAEPAIINMPETYNVVKNNTLIIEPKIQSEGINTYQWYKDGVALSGKTERILKIDNTTENDNGDYTLKVTTSVETTSAEATSNVCKVTVTDSGFTATLTKVISSEEINPGKEFEVSFSINNFKNIQNGLISLAGQLEYNADILEMISPEEGFATGKNGWDLDAYNDKNFKFITDNDKFITEGGEVFTLKFKVKDTINEEKQTTIKVKNISASGGNGKIVANDAQIDINVKMPEEPTPPTPEEPEGITSEVYTIDKTHISRILPKTTVQQFKKNVTTKQEMKFFDKNGNALQADSIIATGMTLKVGKTLEFKLVVTGDVDCDGEITLNDLGKLKLHLIEYELLTGDSLKAGDVDADNGITINDIAQVKLVLIDLMELK